MREARTAAKLHHPHIEPIYPNISKNTQENSRTWTATTTAGCDLGQLPAATGVDEFLLKESGTVTFCRAHQLPLADWRKVLAEQEVQKRK